MKFGLLVAAHLLVGLAATLAVRWWEYEYGDGVLSIVLGLLFCQNALAATWAVLGNTFWIVRWLASAAVLAWLTFDYLLMFPNHHRGWADDAAVLYTLTWALVAAGLSALRMWAGPVRMRADVKAPLRPLQFSLLHLLEAMLLIALAIAAGKLAWPYLKASEISLGSYAILAVGFAMIACLAAWALLGAQRAIGWGVFTFVFSIGIGALELHLIHGGFSGTGLWHFCSMSGSGAVFLMLSLMVVRREGYRFTRMAATQNDSPVAVTTP